MSRGERPCTSCVYRGDLQTGATDRPGCMYILHTGISRVKAVYEMLGVNRMTREAREALHPENCVLHRSGSKRSLEERPVMLPKIQKVKDRRAKMDRETAFMLYREGRQDQEIAKALGVSAGTVRNWRLQNGLKSNYSPDDSRSRDILALYLQGKTDREIRAETGISCSNLVKWRKRRNLKPNPAPLSPAEEERTRLYQMGLSDRQIGERTGSSREMIYRWRHRRELPPNIEPKEMPEPYARGMEAYQRGATDREIAQATGMKKHTVACWRRRMGLPVHPEPRKASQKPEPDWHREAIRLHGEGKTDEEISAAVQRTRSCVSGWRRKAGLPINKALRKRKKGEEQDEG